jgi:hypothetical protein
LLAFIAWVAGLPLPADASDQIVRVFTLRYRRVEEAVLLVRPLLTESGSASLESKLNALTIRDVPAAVERAAQAIASYDVPPRAVTVTVALLKASGDGTPVPATPAPTRVSDQIKGVGETLKTLFSLKSYTQLDAVAVQGVEGDTVAYAVGGEYRLEFLLDPTGSDQVMRLKNLALHRVRRDGVREVRRELLRTSINLQVGQPYVLGLGRDESAAGALFLVFLGSWQGPGPGIAGVR